MTTHRQAGQTAEVVNCLSAKHEDLSSSPSTPHKKLNIVVCVSNPCGGESGTGGSLELWLSRIAESVSSRFSERSF